MSNPIEYSFSRYLASKKSVDDRALNSYVWRTLASHLPKSSPEKPLRVLEIGAGIGTMIERMLAWRLLDYAEYTAIDAEKKNKAACRLRLHDASAKYDFRFEETSLGNWKLNGDKSCIEVRFRDEDFFDFVSQEPGEWDLIVANAFMDLVDISAILPLILKLLNRNGLFYFTINYDGLTVLEPPIDPIIDNMIIELYHRTMNERVVRGKYSGDSQTGRHLFSCLKEAGFHVLAAGASDWVVFAGPNGYSQDEAYLLHFVLNDIQHALEESPELDRNKIENWVAKRHLQVEYKELFYVAHQLDFVGTAFTSLARRI